MRSTATCRVGTFPGSRSSSTVAVSSTAQPSPTRSSWSSARLDRDTNVAERPPQKTLHYGGTPTMHEFIPPAKPLIGDEERAAVDRVMRTGMLAQGPEVKAF